MSHGKEATARQLDRGSKILAMKTAWTLVLAAGLTAAAGCGGANPAELDAAKARAAAAERRADEADAKAKASDEAKASQEKTIAQRAAEALDAQAKLDAAKAQVA